MVWSLLAEMARLPLAELAQQKLDHAAVLRCWELASADEAAEQADDPTLTPTPTLTLAPAPAPALALT